MNSAFAVFLFAVVFMFIGIFSLAVFEPKMDLLDLVFEEVSAFCTVGLHANEGDVDRRLLGDPLHVSDVQGGSHRDRERGDVLQVRHRQPGGAHRLDMCGPAIDERDVVASLHHVRADVTADCASADDGDACGHGHSA